VRLGVLDVGSNTVHLLVVDAHLGAAPVPAFSHKVELHLAEFLEPDGSIDREGVEQLISFINEAEVIAEEHECEELLCFATSAIRDAPNGDHVLDQVRTRTAIELQVLDGADEARLTFLAVRRWFGWSSGRLLVVDIGGGSLEIACGLTEEPDWAVSVPLGAGRVTREFLPDDPPRGSQVKKARAHVQEVIEHALTDGRHLGRIDHAVATSKTLKQLARIAGAAPSAEGPYVTRLLSHEDLQHWVPRLAAMTATKRAGLPGVSTGRARQLLAGAVVADVVMERLELFDLEICPWALREGVILRRLDWIER